MADEFHGTIGTKARRGELPNITEIARQVSAMIGEEFFDSLAKNLSQVLHADCIYLGHFVGGQVERVGTLAAYLDNELRGDSEYALAGSAAAQVAVGEPWSCTRGVLKKFPKDALLQEVQAQACVAVPLVDSKGGTLGVAMALFRHCLSNTHLPKSILEMFAPRVAAEVRRTQEEAALRASEQRYRVFISQNPDPMWRIEFETPIPINLSEDEQIERIYRNGYLAECNEALARILGFNNPEQLIGAGFEDVARRADPRLKDDVRCAVRSGFQLTTVERINVDPAGCRRNLVRSHWGIVQDGKLQRIWGMHREVTGQKRTEEALKVAQRRLKELLESGRLFTILLDSEGSITFCSDYLLRLTGWQAGEVAGKNWFDLMIPPEERARLQAEFAAPIDGEARGPRRLESTVVGRDGRRWRIAWESAALLDSGGSVIGLAAVGCELTGSKKLEDSSGHSCGFEGVGRSIGRIAGSLGDLLTALTGYCTILQNRPPTDQIDGLLREVNAVAEQASGLTQEILRLSREQMLHPELLNLNLLIEEVGRTIRALLPETINLDISLEASPGIVRGDAGQFREVLLILSAHAKQAMLHGGNLTIHSSNVDIPNDGTSPLAEIEPGQYVLMTIADTGSGIGEEDQARLFEPFFVNGKKAGLDLSTVRAIVQQSDGQILVESHAERGTAFEIYLPRIRHELR